MHYRHAFHAGNFADVWKHAILVAVLRALSRKATPWSYLDTHAGAGLYRLEADEATRTGEWHDGIGRLAGRTDLPSALTDYQALVEAAGKGHYPGSPWLAQRLARDGDSLVCCESVADVHAALREHCGSGPAIHRRDGYGADALLPPKAGRGLVLLDPPFERVDEFEAVADFVQRARRRFAHGVYMVWYPLKNRHAAGRMLRRLARDAGRPVWNATLEVGRPQEGRMRACGIVLLNLPWGLDTELAEPLAWLADALAQDTGASHTLEWIEA